MKYTAFALFEDSKAAGDAVGELKEKGYGQDISIVARDEKSGEVRHEQIAHDITDGVTAGAVTGTIFGLVAATISLTPFSVAGFLIAGPLATLWGATTGALAGGIVGALVDVGVPEEKARLFQEKIKKGEVLVAVTAAEEISDDINHVFRKHKANEITTFTL